MKTMTTIEAIQSDYQALVAKLDMKLAKEKEKKPKEDVDEISDEGRQRRNAGLWTASF